MFGIQSDVKEAIGIQNPEARLVTCKARYREVILSFGISSIIKSVIVDATVVINEIFKEKRRI